MKYKIFLQQKTQRPRPHKGRSISGQQLIEMRIARRSLRQKSTNLLFFFLNLSCEKHCKKTLYSLFLLRALRIRAHKKET